MEGETVASADAVAAAMSLREVRGEAAAASSNLIATREELASSKHELDGEFRVFWIFVI